MRRVVPSRVKRSSTRATRRLGATGSGSCRRARPLADRRALSRRSGGCPTRGRRARGGAPRPRRRCSPSRVEAFGAQCGRAGPGCPRERARDAGQRVLERLRLGGGARVLRMSLGAVRVGSHLRARATSIQRRVLLARATDARVELDELVFVELGELGALHLSEQRLLALVQHRPGRLLHGAIVPLRGPR